MRFELCAPLKEFRGPGSSDGIRTFSSQVESCTGSAGTTINLTVDKLNLGSPPFAQNGANTERLHGDDEEGAYLLFQHRHCTLLHLGEYSLSRVDHLADS